MGLNESPKAWKDEEYASKVTTLKEACQPLFRGAKCTKLALVLTMMNLFTIHGATHKMQDDLFSLFSKFVLLDDNRMPKNHSEAKKLTRTLGLQYECIHACKAGHVLYRGEYKDLVKCPVANCGLPRYKQVGRSLVPNKVVRHFPVIPQLRRMYRSPAIAELLMWHKNNRSMDGKIRHPADSLAWAHIDDHIDPSFRMDGRNMWLAVAGDGFAPFSDKISQWSTWPFYVVIYNLPPWLATKKFFVLLALLVPGKESVKMDNFDVFLQPLIEELQQLWSPGVVAFDVRKDPQNRAFTLQAIVI